METRLGKGQSHDVGDHVVGVDTVVMQGHKVECTVAIASCEPLLWRLSVPAYNEGRTKLTSIHHFDPLATEGVPIRYVDDSVELKTV